MQSCRARVFQAGEQKCTKTLRRRMNLMLARSSQKICLTGVSKKGMAGDETGEESNYLGKCSKQFTFHSKCVRKPLEALNKGK